MSADTDKEVTNNEPDPLLEELKKAIGSGQINFLFGAGVNGRCFKNMADFNKTIEKVKEMGGTGNNLEETISSLNEEQRESALDVFIEEFNGYYKNGIQKDNISFINLSDLLKTVSHVIDLVESRQHASKKINIFTLNYDRIVEEALEDNGLFYHSTSPYRNSGSSITDVIGYDVSKRTFIPTFSILKIHGSVDPNHTLNKKHIILPVKQTKIQDALSMEFFNGLFEMKTELTEPNAILFVIGYSGSDSHVNSIIKESVDMGLLVYWFAYSDMPDVPGIDFAFIHIIRPNDGKSEKEKIDCTLSLNNMLKKVLKL